VSVSVAGSGRDGAAVTSNASAGITAACGAAGTAVESVQPAVSKKVAASPVMVSRLP
jgi:hypothetical protein